MITIEQVKKIAEDIKADDGWVNDSHSASEHKGVVMGLEMLITHLEEIIETMRIKIEDYQGNDIVELNVKDSEVIETYDYNIADVDEDEMGQYVRVQLTSNVIKKIKKY